MRLVKNVGDSINKMAGKRSDTDNVRYVSIYKLDMSIFDTIHPLQCYYVSIYISSVHLI